jgi:hypothetical protein
MKKVTVVILVMLSFTVKIDATELQLFTGLEFGVGVYKVDNDFWFNNGSYYYFCHEDTSSVFFAPGLTFGLRIFPENSWLGFVLRDRALFITNGKQTGKISINNQYTSISDTYSIADDDFFVGIMDFDPGMSIRYKISDRLHLYIDLGLNFTIMNSGQYDSGDTLKYFGLGIFSAGALQFNITQKVYLEFGINVMLDMISTQERKIRNPYNQTELKKYEDTGKFDLTTMAAYLTIGWRFDVEQLRGRPANF